MWGAIAPLAPTASYTSVSNLVSLTLQVLCHREDPRLREQEWGNFQDPAKIKEIEKERRQTGAFYYRFPTGERCSQQSLLEDGNRSFSLQWCGRV